MSKENKEEQKEKTMMVADEADIEIFKRYGKGPYSEKIKTLEDEVKKFSQDINKLCGIRESETGLSQPTNWVIEVIVS
jgi:26S proteasome regulatory subunit T1